MFITIILYENLKFFLLLIYRFLKNCFYKIDLEREKNGQAEVNRNQDPTSQALDPTNSLGVAMLS